MSEYLTRPFFVLTFSILSNIFFPILLRDSLYSQKIPVDFGSSFSISFLYSTSHFNSLNLFVSDSLDGSHFLSLISSNHLTSAGISHSVSLTFLGSGSINLERFNLSHKSHLVPTVATFGFILSFILGTLSFLTNHCSVVPIFVFFNSLPSSGTHCEYPVLGVMFESLAERLASLPAGN